MNKCISFSLCRVVAPIGVLATLGAANVTAGDFVSMGENAVPLERRSYDLAGDHWREWVEVSLSGGLRYDDNIFLENSDEESDLIATFGLNIQFANTEDAENQWSISYLPRARFYVDNSERDGVDQTLTLAYSKKLPKTRFDVKGSLQDTSGSNRYAGGFIDQLSYGLTLAATHDVTGKTTLDASLGFDGQDFDSALIDRDRYRAKIGALYQWTGKISVGPYVSYEYVDVTGGSDHDAFGVGGQVDYQVTGKTKLSGSMGYEHRSFNGSSVGDRGLFDYRFELKHALTGKTSLVGSLYRNSNASYVNGDRGYEATGVSLGAEYEATSRITLDASIGYEQTEYYESGSGAAGLDRDADYLDVSFGADYGFNESVSVGTGLLLRTSDSDGGRDYDNTQVFFNCIYRF